MFTSGLDVGLIMLPLTEFPLCACQPEYAFANEWIGLAVIGLYAAIYLLLFRRWWRRGTGTMI